MSDDGGIPFTYEDEIENDSSRKWALENQQGTDEIIENQAEWIEKFTRPDFQNSAVINKKFNRDYTITNLDTTQFYKCQMYRMLIEFCDDFNLEIAKDWFNSRIQDILVLTRSKGGFERLCMITNSLNIQRPPAMETKKKWNIPFLGGNNQ